MDRKAKIEHLQKTDKLSAAGVRVIGSTSLLYELPHVNDNARISDTGQFTLFELIPVAELVDQLPAFCSRYDNGTNKVDTDIILDGIRTLDVERKSNVTRHFKAERHNYHGHHSDIEMPLKKYKLELRVNPTDFAAISDNGLIFDGEILLDRLVFDKNVTLAVRSGLSASARVFDKDGNEITNP